MELNYCDLRDESLFQFEFRGQGDEKIEFFSQETYDYQILGNEALIIPGYEDTEISIFSNWPKVMKEDYDLHKNNP